MRYSKCPICHGSFGRNIVNMLDCFSCQLYIDILDEEISMVRYGTDNYSKEQFERYLKLKEFW